MSGAIVQQTVVITNPHGFHLRPLTAFAQKAAQFQCDVTVTRDGTSVNGKSAWDMMAMLSPPGAALIVQAQGPDAPAALEELVALINTPAGDESPQEMTSDQ